MNLWHWVTGHGHHDGVEEAQQAKQDAARRLENQRQLTPRVERAGDMLSHLVDRGLRGGTP
jgi:hypothetical protein